MTHDRALARAIAEGLTASVHGVYRGGLGVHLALVAIGGRRGMVLDLARVPAEDVRRDDRLLYSESAGRFIITVDPRQREAFETLFEAMPLACIGNVTEETAFVLKGTDGREIAHIDVPALASAWQKPFGDLI
jgi:phosphoribosylformylglycinamidine synthase